METLQHIVIGCQQADRRCQKLLYERYYGYALKTVFRYIYQYDRAVDVTNDGFVKLFRHFDRFHFEPGQLEMMLMGWIRRIMINTAIDRLRKDGHSVEMAVVSDKIWEQVQGAEADESVLYKDLIVLVKKLPPAYRLVFNLFAIDGYSHQEIADMLGISVGTSKSNLSKARSHLQDILKKEFSMPVYAAQ